MPEQPRGKYAGVVDDEKIARNEIVAEPSEIGVLDRATVSMQHEQSRFASVRRRLLRNELLRQREVEVGDVHRLTLPQPGCGWWIVDRGWSLR